MQVECLWQGNMRFLAKTGEHQVFMDAKKPIGSQSAMTPKELVLAGLAGCTAMDVAAYLRKHKQNASGLSVLSKTDLTNTFPSVFTEVELVYVVRGEVEAAILMEAVQLSQTKFCGVSAMLSLSSPIRYRIELNGARVGEGAASFQAKEAAVCTQTNPPSVPL